MIFQEVMIDNSSHTLGAKTTFSAHVRTGLASLLVVRGGFTTAY